MGVVKNNLSNSLGFMDGYVAGNISANESELKLDTERIKSFLDKAKDTFEVIDIDDTTKKKLTLSINAFKEKSFNNLSDVEDFYAYSQDFSDIMSAIKSAISLEKMPTETNFLIKRAILHFLTIAKTLNDQRITENALSIATLYK